MIRLALFLAILMALAPERASAQSIVPERLDDYDIGFWVGPQLRVTSLDGQAALLGGIPLMLVYRGSWEVGIVQSLTLMDVDGLRLGYGGVKGAYEVFPERRYHLSFGLVFAGGGGRLDRPGFRRARTGVFVLEPEVLFSYDLLPFFRVGVGASFRSVSRSDLPTIGGSELSGLTASLQLMFGRWQQKEPPTPPEEEAAY